MLPSVETITFLSKGQMMLQNFQMPSNNNIGRIAQYVLIVVLPTIQLINYIGYMDFLYDTDLEKKHLLPTRHLANLLTHPLIPLCRLLFHMKNIKKS